MSTSLVAPNMAWDGFLEDIAKGSSLEDALRKNRITSKEVTEFTLNPAEATRFFEAKAMARRRAFPPWDLESVCVRVASGMSARAAVVAVRGADDRAAFFELLQSDTALAERFAQAEAAGAHAKEDELLALADDKSGDVLHTDKGPIPSSAAVGRSKLQVETRQWLDKAQHPARYREKTSPNVAVQVNVDHAAVLEEARVRARDHRPTPRRANEVIQARFVEPAIDVVPSEAVWREEIPAKKPVVDPTPAGVEPETEPGEAKKTDWFED